MKPHEKHFVTNHLEVFKIHEVSPITIINHPLNQWVESFHLERTISKYNSRRTSEFRKRDERNSKSSTNISHNLVIRIETYIVWLNSYSFGDFGWWFWTPWLSMMRSMIQRMTVNLYFYHKCVTSKRQMKLNDGQSRTTKYYPSGTHWLPILRWKCVII